MGNFLNSRPYLTLLNNYIDKKKRFYWILWLYIFTNKSYLKKKKKKKKKIFFKKKK